MDARRDALAGAAEWIGAVEAPRSATRPDWWRPSDASTHGQAPRNVIAGVCEASLDVRHAADDAARDARSRRFG